MSLSTRFGLAGKRTLTTSSGRGIGQASTVLLLRPASGKTEQVVRTTGHEFWGCPADFPVLGLLFANADIIRRAPAAVPSGCGSAAYPCSWGRASKNPENTDMGAEALADQR